MKTKEELNAIKDEAVEKNGITENAEALNEGDMEKVNGGGGIVVEDWNYVDIEIT